MIPKLVRVPGRGVMHLLDPPPDYAKGPNLVVHGHKGTNVYVAPDDIKPATPADLAAYLPDERARGLECKRADCWCRWFNPLED